MNFIFQIPCRNKRTANNGFGGSRALVAVTDTGGVPLAAAAIQSDIY